jgi:hypothetical protein
LEVDSGKCVDFTRILTAPLKELEKENNRLKRLLAERDLEVDTLKEYLAKK